MKWLAALVLPALLCGSCSSDESSLRQARLSLAASDANDRHGVLGCVSLPLLQGSRSFERFVVDDLITLTINAEPGQVDVIFQADGQSLAKALSIPRGALLHGYAEEVPLQLKSGERYTVQLSSECEP